jgi:hypothetical protein
MHPSGVLPRVSGSSSGYAHQPTPHDDLFHGLSRVETLRRSLTSTVLYDADDAADLTPRNLGKVPVFDSKEPIPCGGI